MYTLILISADDSPVWGFLLVGNLFGVVKSLHFIFRLSLCSPDEKFPRKKKLVRRRRRLFLSLIHI